MALSRGEDGTALSQVTAGSHNYGAIAQMHRRGRRFPSIKMEAVDRPLGLDRSKWYILQIYAIKSHSIE